MILNYLRFVFSKKKKKSKNPFTVYTLVTLDGMRVCRNEATVNARRRRASDLSHDRNASSLVAVCVCGTRAWSSSLGYSVHERIYHFADPPSAVSCRHHRRSTPYIIVRKWSRPWPAGGVFANVCIDAGARGTGGTTVVAAAAAAAAATRPVRQAGTAVPPVRAQVLRTPVQQLGPVRPGRRLRDRRRVRVPLPGGR